MVDIVYSKSQGENAIKSWLILVAICTSYFQNNLTVENALEIMTAAALTNSKPLLAAAIKFAMKHRGFLNKTSGWDEVKKNYPEITSQVLDEILFNP